MRITDFARDWAAHRRFAGAVEEPHEMTRSAARLNNAAADAGESVHRKQAAAPMPAGTHQLHSSAAILASRCR